MSTHCNRYPGCGCPEEIGIKCHLPEPEIPSNVIRSELHKSICSIISKLPLKKVEGDCYDVISVASEIETLFEPPVSAMEDAKIIAKQLKLVRNYFGENDMLVSEHMHFYSLSRAIDFLESITNKPTSAREDGCPTQEQIDAAIDKYAFRVPYDGSNNFYDELALKHFKAGIEWLKSALTTPTK